MLKGGLSSVMMESNASWNLPSSSSLSLSYHGCGAEAVELRLALDLMCDATSSVRTGDQLHQLTLGLTGGPGKVLSQRDRQPPAHQVDICHCPSRCWESMLAASRL